MGTRMAPSFANLFMSRLETNILSQASVLPLCWWRYIDDIFILWDKSAEDLQDFFEHCNNYHPTIKFTTSVSDRAVNFLDVTVKISEGKISTDLYTKPTDKHLYLLSSSCHPRHCTRSIPKSQALRLRRICSDDATFETRSSELSEHLTKRGYKKPIIKRVIEETRKINRNDTLRYKNKDKSNTRTPLVVTYHPDLPPLAQIVNKHFSILQTNDKLKQVSQNHPSSLIAVQKTSVISLSEESYHQMLQRKQTSLAHILVNLLDAKTVKTWLKLTPLQATQPSKPSRSGKISPVPPSMSFTW